MMDDDNQGILDLDTPVDVQVSLQQYKTLCDAQHATIHWMRGELRQLQNQVAELTKSLKTQASEAGGLE